MTYQTSLIILQITLLIPFVIAFSMFAQKLQNPFLKPTPSFTSNSYSTTSYAPPLPSTYKYSNYNALQKPKPSFFDSGSNNIALSSEVGSYQKPRSSTDIGEILMKNPFNRPATSIFTSSVGNAYAPNNYAQSRYLQANRPSSYNRIQPTNDRYSNYTGDSASMSNPYGATRNTPRKQDNYLSTSSADSAVTYINKIYEIDEDRQTDGFSVGSNPFLRKNLLQEKQLQGTSKFKNSHDDAALKYIATNKSYDKPSYLQNNYLQQNRYFEPYKEPVIGRVNSKEKYAKNGYYQYNQPQYKRPEYESKKYRDSQPPYEPIKKMKEYQSYEYSKPTYNVDEYTQKPHFGSKQEIKKIKSYQQYEENQQDYKDYIKPEFGKKNAIRNQYGDEDDDKFDFEQQKKQFGSFGAPKNYQKDNYDNYDKYQQNYDYKRDSKQNAYKYSFKAQQNYSKPIEQSKRSKKQPQRVFFNEQQHSFSQQSREKKIKQYAEGAFSTLGANSKNKNPYESNSYQRGQQGSKKLISSQVQEYQNYRVEEKLNQAKRSQQKLQDSYKQNSKNQIKSKKLPQQQYQYQDSRQKKSRGPVRDTQDSVPKILEFNGMVFHRVDVK